MPRSVIWKSIAEAISGEITDGQYRPGDRLPTEAALSARFGVNRHTVRQALADLAGRGMVHSRRGSGVFVTMAATEYPLGRRVRFRQNVLATGQSPSRDILRSETRIGNAVEVDALGLREGASVHVVEGLSLADGVPLAMFQSIFPAARFPDFLRDVVRLQSISDCMAAAGVADYTRASTRLTAIVADPLLALHLRLPEGAPLLRSVAINIDIAGQPVEYGTTWFAGDRVTLTVAPD
jgi:GntR family phosphonate transport system transcriptional regulator